MTVYIENYEIFKKNILKFKGKNVGLSFFWDMVDVVYHSNLKAAPPRNAGYIKKYSRLIEALQAEGIIEENIQYGIWNGTWRIIGVEDEREEARL